MPGFTDIQAAKVAQEMKTAWGETNEIRLTRRKLRQRKLDPPLPPGWSKNIHIKHKTYEIDDAVRVLRNRLLGASISLLVFAKSGAAGGQAAASDLRSFLDKVWLDFNKGIPSNHFIGTDSQVGDGVWPAHLIWDHDWIDKALEAAKNDSLEKYLLTAGLPWLLESVDPLSVFVEFDRTKRPQLVVASEEVPISELVGQKFRNADGDEFHLGFDKAKDELFQSTEPLSYDNVWSGDFRKTVEIASLEDSGYVHRVLIRGGEETPLGLGKWPNLFKRPAWAFIPGDFSNSTNPLERWKPMVLGLLSMGEELNGIRSARYNSGMLAGLPRRKMRRRKDDTGFGAIGKTEEPELVYREDGMVQEPEGWEEVPLEFPVASDAILQNALLNTEAEAAMFKPAPALRGVKEEGVSSGYQQALIAEAAMTDLDPALEMQSQGIREIFQLVLEGAKAVQREAGINTLYVQSLTQKQVDGKVVRTSEALPLRIGTIDDFEITVRQSSMSPTSRIGMREEGRRARLAGEIDDIEFYESFAGYEDGVEMSRRATEQKMYDSQLPDAIATAQAIVREKIARRRPTVILGPNGLPLPPTNGGTPQSQGVPGGAAVPGLDATLVQPTPPGPQPLPLGPQGGQAG